MKVVDEEKVSAFKGMLTERLNSMPKEKAEAVRNQLLNGLDKMGAQFEKDELFAARRTKNDIRDNLLVGEEKELFNSIAVRAGFSSDKQGVKEDLAQIRGEVAEYKHEYKAKKHEAEKPEPAKPKPKHKDEGPRLITGDEVADSHQPSKKKEQGPRLVIDEDENRPKVKPQPQPQQQAQPEQKPKAPGGMNVSSRINEDGMIEVTRSLGGQKLVEFIDPKSEYGKAWMADNPQDFKDAGKKQGDLQANAPDAVKALPADALAQVNNIKAQTASTAPPSANASLPAVQKGQYLS